MKVKADMTVTVLKNADIYTGAEHITNGYVRFDKQILAVGPMSEYHPTAQDEVHDIGGLTLVPGFIDVHSHGGYGFDAMDGNAEDDSKLATDVMTHEGVTSFFLTTMTQSTENLDKAMVAAKEAAEKNPIIQGVHLEGPFISATFKGAQPEKYIKDPDADLLDEWNKLSGNNVRLITYAPENKNASAFEDYCLANNIVPAVGHSNATRKDLINSKATHATHLYNAQREFKHREPGVTGHVMLEKNIYAELICDGFHIVPDMIELAYQEKGPERVELVTDSMRAKGLPEGVSELGGQKVIVKDRQARLESGNLAGSVLRFDDAFRNIMKFTDCPIDDAVLMSSVNQAREFGLTQKGGIMVGKDADINVMDQEYQLQATYSFGDYHEHVED